MRARLAVRVTTISGLSLATSTFRDYPKISRHEVTVRCSFESRMDQPRPVRANGVGRRSRSAAFQASRAMRFALRVETLESRLTPAAVFTYTDVDGDSVTVRTNRGTDAELAAIISLAPEGIGQELQRIDFSLNAPVFAGTNLSVTARRTAAAGDGRVNVGYIDASFTDGGTSLDLGKIVVRGDLGQIDAGDPPASSLGVRSISVQSLGQFGTSTQAPGGNLNSDIQGRLGLLKVAGSVTNSRISSDNFGAVNIGGSLVGGNIDGSGPIGPVRIGGNIEGGLSGNTGVIRTTGIGGTLASLRIGGSLIGGAGDQSGCITSARAMGPINIRGNIEGGGGTLAGGIDSDRTLSRVIVAGSLSGGAGPASGRIFSGGPMGRVRINGSIVGGTVTRQALSSAAKRWRTSTLWGTSLGAASPRLSSSITAPS